MHELNYSGCDGLFQNGNKFQARTRPGFLDQVKRLPFQIISAALLLTGLLGRLWNAVLLQRLPRTLTEFRNCAVESRQ